MEMVEQILLLQLESQILMDDVPGDFAISDIQRSPAR